MKNKFISNEEWGSAILPNSGTSFSTISPFEIIGSGPHFAWAWAGVLSCVSGPSVPIGTIFGGRRDLINKTDEWLAFSTAGSVLLQDVQKKKKKEIPDHHTEELPIVFKDAPKTIKDFFKEKTS